MNPYHHFVSELDRLVREGRRLPLGGFPAKPRPAHAGNAPRVLIFSPHPDDECIIGGFALRLLREAGMRVINVAVTQGSRQDRQAARWDELQAACRYLGFGLIATGADGLHDINVRTRAAGQRATRRRARRGSGRRGAGFLVLHAVPVARMDRRPSATGARGRQEPSRHDERRAGARGRVKAARKMRARG